MVNVNIYILIEFLSCDLSKKSESYNRAYVVLNDKFTTNTNQIFALKIKIDKQIIWKLINIFLV